MSDETSTIREAMRLLGLRRWQSMTEAQRAEHVRRMVAGQRKARKHRAAKIRTRG